MKGGRLPVGDVFMRSPPTPPPFPVPICNDNGSCASSATFHSGSYSFVQKGRSGGGDPQICAPFIPSFAQRSNSLTPAAKSSSDTSAMPCKRTRSCEQNSATQSL